MTIDLEIQRATDSDTVPADAEFHQWVTAALESRPPCQLTIRIVDREEAAALNARYRGREGPTNVLSFPAELPAVVDLPLLGDIVICAPVVRAEAMEQEKPETAHWAHLVIHGVLHLLGMDHQEESDARDMEAREISLLSGLGYPDPYL